MSEAGKTVLDALLRGMEIEKETFDFHTRAEHKTFDPEGKRVFRWLAKSEEAHYLKLTELYNALDQGGPWVYYGGSTITLEPQGAEFRDRRPGSAAPRHGCRKEGNCLFQ